MSGSRVFFRGLHAFKIAVALAYTVLVGCWVLRVVSNYWPVTKDNEPIAAQFKYAHPLLLQGWKNLCDEVETVVSLGTDWLKMWCHVSELIARSHPRTSSKYNLGFLQSLFHYSWSFG